MAARYAIYFVPSTDTDLAKLGVSSLGWDIDRAETKMLDAFSNLKPVEIINALARIHNNFICQGITTLES